MNIYFWLVLAALIIAFAIYFFIDLISNSADVNKFWDKWVRKILWIWLPFYALQRLIKEVILKKK